MHQFEKREHVREKVSGTDWTVSEIGTDIKCWRFSPNGSGKKIYQDFKPHELVSVADINREVKEREEAEEAAKQPKKPLYPV